MDGPVRKWFESSYSSADGPDCVEVVMTHPTVHVRDSEARHRTPLTFGRRAWGEFVQAIGPVDLGCS
ncbi:DUF397 domain-containing protein [Streptomyces cinereospinus]|uniref:DUF397 domain-containing protein n=1 Tax=Streptomyces cinereospinus TaxID=285561 RepID=A0ABV5N712_9ACTN